MARLTSNLDLSGGLPGPFLVLLPGALSADTRTATSEGLATPPLPRPGRCVDIHSPTSIAWSSEAGCILLGVTPFPAPTPDRAAGVAPLPMVRTASIELIPLTGMTGGSKAGLLVICAESNWVST